MRQIYTRAALAIGAAAGTALIGQHAWARDVAAPASSTQSDTAEQGVTQGAGEIIATARRRAQNLQSTPLPTISAAK